MIGDPPPKPPGIIMRFKKIKKKYLFVGIAIVLIVVIAGIFYSILN